MISPEFSRSAILYGGDAQKKMESATVAVCGVGAVGSFALEALARIGVGSFVLVDADTVDVSNINRQLCALHSTIGKSKTAVMCERVRDINPNARVEIVDRFIDESNCAEFVGLCPDVIVDAIDSLAPKAALAAAALSEGVPIVSSMGAARKTDPLKVAAAELFKTHSCPMAARMRKELRARGIQKRPALRVFDRNSRSRLARQKRRGGREKNNWEHAHCNGDVRACAGKPRPCSKF